MPIHVSLSPLSTPHLNFCNLQTGPYFSSCSWASILYPEASIIFSKCKSDHVCLSAPLSLSLTHTPFVKTFQWLPIALRIKTKTLTMSDPILPAWLSCLISGHSPPQFLCLATLAFFGSSKEPDSCFLLTAHFQVPLLNTPVMAPPTPLQTLSVTLSLFLGYCNLYAPLRLMKMSLLEFSLWLSS